MQSVLDLGCGFNPLAAPWMDLAEGASYRAYDLYGDVAEFVQQALSSFPSPASLRVSAESRDLATPPPNDVESPADLALVLKLLPLLDRCDCEHTLTWMRGLHARFALISFPTRTLGGRSVGMAASYESQFAEVLQAGAWEAERTDFENELCFLVDLKL